MVRRIGVREGRVSGMKITSSTFLEDGLIRLGEEGNQPSFSCPHLFDIGDDLLIDLVLGRKDNDRHLPVDQGDGPMLHLTGRISFRMDIGDLFQLQRPFQGNRDS